MRVQKIITRSVHNIKDMIIAKTNEIKTKQARLLRVNQTDTERLMWYYLRNRRLKGYKFKRQYVIGNYIVDFVCLEKKLIVELDGGHHQVQANYDQIRTNFLKSRGFEVVRFWNNDFLNNTYAVLNIICSTLDNIK